MKGKEKKNSIFSGLFWTFGERIIAQLVSLAVTIVLARILDPEHYGIISIVTVFITFCNIFVSSGFGSAVVQKKNPDEDDFNTAFVIGFIMSLILYIVLFFASPYIAKFYDMPILSPVMRVMGLRLILASMNTIQHAYIQKNMQFKKFFFATLFGTVISAFIGIAMAIYGFGVWALVVQYLTNTVIDTLMLLFIGGWIPRFKFIKEKAKQLFSFGWKILVTEAVFTLEGDIRSLIVGKVFGSADLAYYDQGKKYPSLLITNINSSINKVMLPAYADKQDNIEELKKILRKSIRVGVYLLAPLLIGFAMVSKNFISILLTDKWLNCVPYIQIFCLIYLTRPLESSCHQALLGLGDSGIVMKIIIAINIFAILTIFVAVWAFKSVFLIAVGSLLSSFISIILFMIVAKKKINYTFREQFSDISETLLIGLIMGGIVYAIGLIKINIIIIFIFQILAGFVCYLGLSIVTKNKSYLFLKEKILNIFRKKFSNARR